MVNLVCVYSGGMDSYTLLRSLHRNLVDQERLHAISFNYGQRHKRELYAAHRATSKLGIEHTVISLANLRSMMRGSALTDDIDVPHGHYEAESMKKTVVPGRNTLLLACALSFAEGLHPSERAAVYYGAHSGDHHIYPDCRPLYISAMKEVFHHATDGRVMLRTPFSALTKGQVLGCGISSGVLPEDYADTWTCYEGGEHPCGACGACVERAEAFAFNNIADPLLLAKAG